MGEEYHGLNEANYDGIVEWEKSILHEGNRVKDNFYIVKSKIKLFSLVYQEFTCVQTFTWYTTVKIQILPSTEPTGMLVINPKLLGEGLFSYKKKIKVLHNHS